MRIARGVVKLVLNCSKSSNALLQVGALSCGVLLQSFKCCALVAKQALQFCHAGVCTVCVAIKLVLQLSLPDKTLLEVAGVALQLCKRGAQVAQVAAPCCAG